MRTWLCGTIVLNIAEVEEASESWGAPWLLKFEVS